MNQTTPTLFDLVPPYQRHSATSRAAAQEIAPQLHALQAKVLTYLRNRPDGATDIEIQDALEMDGSTQRPRRIELQNMGLITASGKRIPPGKRRESTIWKVKV